MLTCSSASLLRRGWAPGCWRPRLRTALEVSRATGLRLPWQPGVADAPAPAAEPACEAGLPPGSSSCGAGLSNSSCCSRSSAQTAGSICGGEGLVVEAGPAVRRTLRGDHPGCGVQLATAVGLEVVVHDGCCCSCCCTTGSMAFLLPGPTTNSANRLGCCCCCSSCWTGSGRSSALAERAGLGLACRRCCCSAYSACRSASRSRMPSSSECIPPCLQRLLGDGCGD